MGNLMILLDKMLKFRLENIKDKKFFSFIYRTEMLFLLCKSIPQSIIIDDPDDHSLSLY